MENYVRICATNIKIRKARTKEYIYVYIHSHNIYIYIYIYLAWTTTIFNIFGRSRCTLPAEGLGPLGKCSNSIQVRNVSKLCYFLQKDSFRSQFTSVHSSYNFWVFLLTAGKTAQLETKGAIPPSSRNQLQA